jgi:hypothetical protein
MGNNMARPQKRKATRSLCALLMIISDTGLNETNRRVFI